MKLRRSFRTPLTMLAGSLLLHVGSAFAADVDFLDMPLEELSKVQIISTPKFSENPDYNPSAISILTQADIRSFGWRSISDALRTLQGFNVTNDHAYTYAGVRGISPVGDFRARMQVLIDGASINENIYAAAPLDSAFPLDIGLVERIEVIRGPSAAVYGNDSMFGVINIVTRSGNSLGNGEVELGAGSGRERKLRASWRGQLAGKDIVLSASSFNADGLSLGFRDTLASGDRQQLHALGGEQGGQFFFRVRATDWRLNIIHGERDRTVATGSYTSIPDDRGHVETDRYSLIDFNKDWELAPKLMLHQRFYAGQYGYDGIFPYDMSPVTPYLLNIDKARGSWLGTDHRLVSTLRPGHRLTLSLEYRNNIRQNQLNYDLGYGCLGYSSAPCLDDQQRSEQLTLLAQDEIVVNGADTLIIGLRYDKNGAFWSPRLGIIHNDPALGLFKLLYGTAFRQPSPYEKAYVTPTYSYGNPGISPELMKSIELSWEKQFSPLSRLSTTIYSYRIKHLISTDSSGIVSNTTPVNASGLELAYEQRWFNGVRLRGNITAQHAADEHGHLDNSPKLMAKLNLAFPTLIHGLSGGLEGQWIDSRQVNMGQQKIGSYLLTNLNFRYQPEASHWEAGLGIYNLLDRRYQDPVSPDLLASGLTRSAMPQLGRTLQLRTVIRF